MPSSGLSDKLVAIYLGERFESEAESDFSSEENEFLKERMPLPSSPIIFESRPGPKSNTTITSTIISSVGPTSNIFYILSPTSVVPSNENGINKNRWSSSDHRSSLFQSLDQIGNRSCRWHMDSYHLSFCFDQSFIITQSLRAYEHTKC